MDQHDWSDSVGGDSDDPAVWFGVPSDHPAFRSPDDDDEGIGDISGPVGDGRAHDEVGSPILHFPVGRYDGFGGQGDGQGDEPTDHVPRDGDPRQRAADARWLADRLDRAREAIGTRAIGQRNAIAHTRDVADGEGSGGSHEERSLESLLAESLELAGIKFREGLEQPVEPVGPEPGSPDQPAIDHPLEQPVAPVAAVIPLTRLPVIQRVPSFQKCAVRGQLAGLKSNTAGDWIVTLKVDADCHTEVTQLAFAHGLALEIAIRRKPRD